MAITKLSPGLIEPGTISNEDLNSSVSSNISSAFSTANSASSYANSGFAAANTAEQKAVTSGVYANSGFASANTADQRAVTSGVYANSGFAAANTADQKSVTSGSYANSAFVTSNSASSYANSGYAAANTADQKAVSAGSYANSSFARANNSLNSSTGGLVTANVTIRAINAIRAEEASTQDAIIISGRAGGTSSYASTLKPAVLTGNTTVTIPNETFTIGFRNVPASGVKTSEYTLTTTDVGKYVEVGSGGSIVIPNNVFSSGDIVGIFNNTSANTTITCSINTSYISGVDTDVSSVILTTRGIASILFSDSNTCVIMGNVV